MACWPLMVSSSLRALWRKPSAADWIGGMSVVLHRRSICSLSRAVDGCIPRRGTISPCQSAATFKIVKRCCSRVFACKQRCAISSIQTFTLVPFVTAVIIIRNKCMTPVRVAISQQRVIRSTSCLVLGWGFRGRRIEWRYFRFDQIQDGRRSPSWENSK